MLRNMRSSFSPILDPKSVVLVLLWHLQHDSITIQACGTLSLDNPTLNSGHLTLEEYSLLNITISFRNESCNANSEMKITISSSTDPEESIWAPQCSIVLKSNLCRGSFSHNMTCMCLTNFTYMLVKKVDSSEPKYWKVSAELASPPAVHFTLNVTVNQIENIEMTTSQPLHLVNDLTHIVPFAIVAGISTVCAFIMLIILKRKRNTAEHERSFNYSENLTSTFSRTFVAQSVTKFDFVENCAGALDHDYAQMEYADHVEPSVKNAQCDNIKSFSTLPGNVQSVTEIEEEQGFNNYLDDKKNNSVSSGCEEGGITKSAGDNTIRCTRCGSKEHSEVDVKAPSQNCENADKRKPGNQLETGQSILVSDIEYNLGSAENRDFSVSITRL